MKTSLPSRDDLDWLAFRYVAGELAGDEAARFEEWLATDQAPREAVARAVEIAQAVIVLEPESTRSSRNKRRETTARLRWGVCGAAAAVCLSIAVGLVAIREGRGPSGREESTVAERGISGRLTVEPPKRAPGRGLPADDLLALWTQAWSTHESSDYGSDENHDTDAAALESTLAMDPYSMEADPTVSNRTGPDFTETGVVVPDWMLAAVVDDSRREGDGPAGIPSPEAVHPGRQMEN